MSSFMFGCTVFLVERLVVGLEVAVEVIELRRLEEVDPRRAMGNEAIFDSKSRSSSASKVRGQRKTRDKDKGESVQKARFPALRSPPSMLSKSRSNPGISMSSSSFSSSPSSSFSSGEDPNSLCLPLSTWFCLRKAKIARSLRSILSLRISRYSLLLLNRATLLTPLFGFSGSTSPFLCPPTFPSPGLRFGSSVEGKMGGNSDLNSSKHNLSESRRFCSASL